MGFFEVTMSLSHFQECGGSSLWHFKYFSEERWIYTREGWAGIPTVSGSHLAWLSLSEGSGQEWGGRHLSCLFPQWGGPAAPPPPCPHPCTEGHPQYAGLPIASCCSQEQNWGLGRHGGGGRLQGGGVPHACVLHYGPHGPHVHPQDSSRTPLTSSPWSHHLSASHTEASCPLANGLTTWPHITWPPLTVLASKPAIVLVASLLRQTSSASGLLASPGLQWSLASLKGEALLTAPGKPSVAADELWPGFGLGRGRFASRGKQRQQRPLYPAPRAPAPESTPPNNSRDFSPRPQASSHTQPRWDETPESPFLPRCTFWCSHFFQSIERILLLLR